jgi:hypothetical protein
LGVRHGLGRIRLDTHHASVHRQLGRLHSQALGGSGHQRRTRGGASAAQLAAALGDGEVGACEPLVWRGGGVAHHHGDGFEGHVKLFSGNLGQRGFGACAQVHLADVDRDLAVGVHHQKGVHHVFGHAPGGFQGGGGGVGQ